MTKAELEQRVKDRHTAYLYISIYQKPGNSFFGLLADLSDGGFKMTSEHKIATGMEYELQVKNPHMEPANCFNAFSAKALWSVSHEHDIYETGFEFVTRSTEAEALFLKLENDFEATSVAINNLDLEDYIVAEDK